ncbi:MAG TPA: GAF domain-containing protein, partial [Anaerolineales bacterium]|nr:GAF domain-containing protein [Anaerolineales bacterium]
MIAKIFDFFKDEQDTDPVFIRMVRNILLFVMIIIAALLPLVTSLAGETARNPLAFIMLSITLALQGISLSFVMRGKPLMAKVVVPLSLIVTVTIISLNTNGLKNTSMVGLPVILVIAAILLGRRALLIITPLAVFAVVIVAIEDLNNRIVIDRAGVDDAFIIPILVIGCAAIIQVLISRLNENILKARENERNYLKENIELTELRSTLENRVNQRTLDLEIANKNNEQRARQFEAIAQVVRAISSIQDLNVLLPLITQVVSEQFEMYHAGIFLLDEPREFAVLRASNSDGGNKMLARAHKLQVGQTSIVGFVSATGQPRIALDVGTDAVFFDNPDLPDTRSEIALPLRYAGQIIGALDVQSTEPNAFGENDIEALTTLADQIAVAINNTIILEEARKAFLESQNRFGQSTLDSWKVMRPKSLGLGFQFADSSIQPLEKPLEGDYIQEAIQQEKLVLSNTENNISGMAIPIRLRGQVIGIMNLRSRIINPLTQDDADIAQAVTERLSLALETATLLQTTQHRADIERITTDI